MPFWCSRFWNHIAYRTGPRDQLGCDGNAVLSGGTVLLSASSPSVATAPIPAATVATAPISAAAVPTSPVSTTSFAPATS